MEEQISTPKTEMAEGQGPNPYFEGQFDGESDDLRALRLALVRERDEARARVLADVVEMLSTQHTWLTKVAVINLVAGLYGQADKVFALAATEAP